MRGAAGGREGGSGLPGLLKCFEMCVCVIDIIIKNHLFLGPE